MGGTTFTLSSTELVLPTSLLASRFKMVEQSPNYTVHEPEFAIDSIPDDSCRSKKFSSLKVRP